MLKQIPAGLAAIALSACAALQPAPAPAPAGSPAVALRDFYRDIPDAALPMAPPGAPALAGDALITRIAIGSCSEETLPIPLLRAAAEDDPDLFLYIGDNVYGDAYSGDMRLEELRQAYSDLAGNPDFLAMWSSVPVLAVWDDHDYGLNDAGGDFSAKEFSERIFERFWRVPEDEPRRARPGVHASYVHGPDGRRVQIILLDTRFFRDPLKPTDERGAPGRERYLPDPDPARTMLGEAQWDWLEETLQEPADLRLLVSSIQVVADGHGWESWRMLPTERERLYGLIDRVGADGVVMISGDRHRAGIYRLDGKTDYPLYELTASSLNKAFGGEEEAGPNRIGPTFTGENYGLLEIDWAHGRLDLMVRDGGRRTVLSQSVPMAEIGAR